MDETTLRELAETLRTELPDLIPDPAEREPVEKRLAQALHQPVGTAIDALHDALRAHPATRDWMRSTTEVTHDTDAAIGSLGIETAASPLYMCPKGDYSIVRDTVTTDSLFCPRDGSILERA